MHLKSERNFLLSEPQIVTLDELKSEKRYWEALFFQKTHGYILIYSDGAVAFLLEYYDALPEELHKYGITKFSVETRIISNKETQVYSYFCGSPGLKKDMAGTRIGFSSAYHVARPRSFKKAIKKPHPQEINIEQMVGIIKSQKVIFYTGAGISAVSGVPTMNELKNKLGIDISKPVDRFIKSALWDPEIALKTFCKLCYSAFDNPPTAAHQALATISKYKRSKIITENFDLLHERAGIKTYHMENARIKDDIHSAWLMEIEAIICMGLSFDDRGFLNWYKQVNPKGTIVSIDLVQPDYLGDEDLFLKRDLQEVLPRIERHIVSE